MYDAPNVFGEAVLNYLNRDLNDVEKAQLPSKLDVVKKNATLQEMCFRLRYIVKYLRVGPIVGKNHEHWIERGLMSFSGAELARGLTLNQNWGGITELLWGIISASKGRTVSMCSNVWVEHDVKQIAADIIKDDIKRKTFSQLDDFVTFDEAPYLIRKMLMNLVCTIEENIAWYENGRHVSYVYFTWQEGFNEGNYHMLFDSETGTVLGKWIRRWRAKLECSTLLKGGIQVYGYVEQKYRYKDFPVLFQDERKILLQASMELQELKSEVRNALQAGVLGKDEIEIILEYWGFDFTRQIFRILKKKYGSQNL